MINIVFVCHGNICRSPMAEIIFNHLVEEKGLGESFHVESRAISYEEYGNPIYPPARREIQAHGLKVDEMKQAQVIEKKEYDNWDYILIMDHSNERGLNRILGGDPQGKVHYLMEYTDTPGEVEDPWYTRNFHKVWDQLYAGCEGLLNHILRGN